jgi:hypothetical protein
MNRSAVALVALTALLAGGCVSKKEYEGVQAELATCQEEKAAAQADVLSWQQRYDRETARWDQMEQSITDAVPKALIEFNSEKERILGLVPEQVKFEVQSYLEDYFNTVMKGFELLKKDNDEIRLQLAATQGAVETVGLDTRSIGQALDEKVAVEQRKREQVATQLAALVAEIGKFDSTYVNCKSCPQYLSLSKKERDAIMGFHADMTAKLSQLQTFSGE